MKEFKKEMKVNGVLTMHLGQPGVVGGRDEDMVVGFFLTKEMVLGLVEGRILISPPDWVDCDGR